MNFGQFGVVTAEFTRVKGVHRLVDQHFRYVRLVAPMLEILRSQLSFFVGRSVLSFFHLLARGVTAMPRGLHARLGHGHSS